MTTATGPSFPPPLPPEPPAPPAPAAPPPVPPAGSGITALRVVGTIVVLLVVAGATLDVITHLFHQHREESVSYAQPVNALSVRTSQGDVRVSVGATGSPVVVRRILEWSFGTAGSAESITNGTLDVAARCSGGLGIGDCTVGYDITVPPGLAVTVHTSTGDVDATGPVGDLKVASSTGDVTLRGATSTRAEVDTSTGDVDVSFAAPARTVLVRTSTGDVTVVVPADGTGYDVQTASSTGDRTVDVPTSSTAGRLIDVRTSTGDIDVHAGS